MLRIYICISRIVTLALFIIIRKVSGQNFQIYDVNVNLLEGSFPCYYAHTTQEIYDATRICIIRGPSEYYAWKGWLINDFDDFLYYSSSEECCIQLKDCLLAIKPNFGPYLYKIRKSKITAYSSLESILKGSLKADIKTDSSSLENEDLHAHDLVPLCTDIKLFAQISQIDFINTKTIYADSKKHQFVLFIEKNYDSTPEIKIIKFNPEFFNKLSSCIKSAD